MPKDTLSSHILRSLASERRAVAADWRIYVAYMRVALSQGFALPDKSKFNLLIQKLLKAGDIGRVNEISGVYRITVPYASVLPFPSEAIIQEANPTAVFSHFTAAQYHNLTYEIPNAYHLTQYRDSKKRLPLGTTPEDWIEVPGPRQRTPAVVNGTAVYWHHSKAEWDFGYTIGHVQGSPIYITDLERTVIDALRFPEWCGGPTEVLHIWKRAINAINVETLIEYVEILKQTLLRQRVGYLLELLGKCNSALDNWAEKSVRGSSAKLFANLEFSAKYSTRWNLSLNVPDAILTDEYHD
jgi:predicted transcriptional regulator of viral defense system